MISTLKVSTLISVRLKWCQNIHDKTVKNACIGRLLGLKPETLYLIKRRRMAHLVYRMVDHYQPDCYCHIGEEEFLLPGERTAYVCRHCGATPFMDGSHHDDNCPRYRP